MHRIDTKTAQVDKFGAGKNGYTNGDKTVGRLATQLDADVFDAFQEELCSVIEGAGIALNKSDRSQLLKAVKSLFLNKSENLGDLNNIAKALENLGLNMVGNWAAVQANGGKHSSGNHHYYMDWGTDGKLHITVDATDVGELFTTQNPPSVSQIDGAYPKTGGYLNEEASISIISNSKYPANGDYIYSPMYRVVIKGRGGDQDFKDGASGFMRIVEHVGYEAYLQLQWDGFGSVHEFIFDQNGSTRIHGKAYTGGGQSYLNEDGNVYGPAWGGWLSNWILQQINALNIALNNQISATINNNNVWISQSFVTGVRLAGLTAAAAWNGPGFNDTAGYVLTGAQNGNQDQYIDTIYARALQYCINGGWYTAASV